MLSDLYADFLAVLRSTEPGHAAADAVLLPEGSENTDVADVLSAPPTTSLAAKLESGSYSDPAAFYHDLKLVFAVLVAQFPQNSAEYAEVSQLFKFAADLLLREANRLGLVKLGSGTEEEDENLTRISQGFQKISAEVQDYNTESFWVTAGAGPLFTSITNKAPIDPRDTAVAGSVHTTRLLPHVSKATESTLGAASPLNPNNPQPYFVPSDMMSRFVHPNVHVVPPPMWLTGQDSYATFAPSIYSAGSVVADRDASEVWLQRSQALAASSRDTAGSGTESTGSSGSDGSAQTGSSGSADSAGGETVDGSADGNSAAASDSDTLSESGSPRPSPLQPEELEALLRWSPYSFVDDDELSARQAGDETALVSALLLELQEHQRARLAKPLEFQEITDTERHTALKISNMLSRLVEDSTPEQTQLPLDPRMPVLMRNYGGTLPPATDPALQMQSMQGGFAPLPQQPSSMRLHTIAGLRHRTRMTGRR